MRYSFAPSHRTEWGQRLTWPQSAPSTFLMRKTSGTSAFPFLNGFKQAEFSYLSAKEKSPGPWIETVNPVRSSESSSHSRLGLILFSALWAFAWHRGCQKSFLSLIHIGFLLLLLFLSWEKGGGGPLFNSHEFNWGWWAWVMKGKTRIRAQVLSKHSGDGAISDLSGSLPGPASVP